MNAREAALELEHFLPYRLSVLSNRVSRAIAARYAAQFGIGITEWRLVAVLGRTPGLFAAQLSERTAMDKVAVSRAVSALINKGLVKRALASNDRRRAVLRLSAKGGRLYAQIAPLALAIERELLAGFTAAERKSLLGLLDRLDGAVSALETV